MHLIQFANVEQEQITKRRIQLLHDEVEQLAAVKKVNDDIDQHFAQVRNFIALVNGGGCRCRTGRVIIGIVVLPFRVFRKAERFAVLCRSVFVLILFQERLQNFTDVVGNKQGIQIFHSLVQTVADGVFIIDENPTVAALISDVKLRNRVGEVFHSDVTDGGSPRIGVRTEQVVLNCDVSIRNVARSVQQVVKILLELLRSGLNAAGTDKDSVIQRFNFRIGLFAVRCVGNIGDAVVQPVQESRRLHFDVGACFQNRFKGIVSHTGPEIEIDGVKLRPQTGCSRRLDQMLIVDVGLELFVRSRKRSGVVVVVFFLGAVGLPTFTEDKGIELAAVVLDRLGFVIHRHKVAVDLLQVLIGLAWKNRRGQECVKLRSVKERTGTVDAVVRAAHLLQQGVVVALGDTVRVVVVVRVRRCKDRLDIVKRTVGQNVAVDSCNHRRCVGQKCLLFQLIGRAVGVLIKELAFHIRCVVNAVPRTDGCIRHIPGRCLIGAAGRIGRNLAVNELHESVGIFQRVLLGNVHLRRCECRTDGRGLVEPKAVYNSALSIALAIEAVCHIRKDIVKDAAELIVLLIFERGADGNEAVIIALFIRTVIGRGVLRHNGVQLRGIVRRIRFIDGAHETVFNPVLGLFPALADLRLDIGIPKRFVICRTGQVRSQRKCRQRTGAGNISTRGRIRLLNEFHDLVDRHAVKIKVEPRLERIILHAVLERRLDSSNRCVVFGHNGLLRPSAACRINVTARGVEVQRRRVIGSVRFNRVDIRLPRKDVVARADGESHIGRCSAELKVVQERPDIRKARLAGCRKAVAVLHVGDRIVHGLRIGAVVTVAADLHIVIEGLGRLEPAGVVAVNVNCPVAAAHLARHTGVTNVVLLGGVVCQVHTVLEVIIHVGDRVEQLSRLRRGVCTEHGEADRDARHDHHDGQQAT